MLRRRKPAVSKVPKQVKKEPPRREAEQVMALVASHSALLLAIQQMTPQPDRVSTVWRQQRY